MRLNESLHSNKMVKMVQNGVNEQMVDTFILKKHAYIAIKHLKWCLKITPKRLAKY